MPNGAVRFMYDEANHLIGEYQADGTPTREYVWLGDLPVAVIDTNTDGTTTAYAIETDHLGTPRLLTDATQSPSWRWTSPPFGEVPPDENPAGLDPVTFNLRFPGQYYDKESGLSYNWHRVYDAETGRYVQSDPIGLAGGWNTYSYVNGNSLSYTDFYGLAASVRKCGSKILGVSTREYDELIEKLLWKITTPGLLPTGRPSLGPNIDPRNPRSMPVKPEVELQLILYDLEYWQYDTYRIIEVFQKLLAWCTWTEKDQCGREYEHTDYHETEKLIDSSRNLISSQRRFKRNIIWRSPAFGL